MISEYIGLLCELRLYMPLRTSVVQSVFFLIFILPFLPSVNANNSSSSLASAQVRDLTQAPTRIVWCQDMGDGVDTGIEETQFRLMGFDTEDARGERAILPDLSGYSRPLLTPSGNRVIFSNRKDNKIYIVHWDGTGLRCLGNGYAVAVWQDPIGGVEWVYGGSWATNTDAMFPIQRAPIDQPDRIETIWSRTLVHADNFQISADGRRACGNFPWPVCGIAELPDRDWKKYGAGCWPSLAPGNVNLLWIFDGAHQNLTLFRTDADERWVINISRVPGIDGYEVYHPRWANHPRFMVMTGPYKVGEGNNRIRGGGPDVEIYLGRFDERFRAIERWIRVTHNTRADFYPDAWIVPRETRGKPDAPTVVSAPAVPKVTAWLENKAGLVFLWANRAGKNEIPQAAGQVSRLCRTEPRGKARYGRFFEMDLARGYFSTEPDTGAQVLAACRNSNQFSLEAVLTPRQTERLELSRIISFTGPDSGNFVLGQERDRLIFRLHTSATGGQGPAIQLCRLTSGVPHHVVINYLPGQLACFLNGTPLLLTNVPTGNLDGWGQLAEPVGLSKPSPYQNSSSTRELVFGDRDRFWPGQLDHIALYQRVREEAEVRQSYQSLAGDLERRTPARRMMVEARLAELTAIPTPAAISPYRRALVVNRYNDIQVIKGQCPDQQLMVAHWVILDGQVLDTARRQKDKVYRMTLEPFDEHPELEGERLVMESEDYALPLFYEVE